jgi:hypothetical protein
MLKPQSSPASTTPGKRAFGPRGKDREAEAVVDTVRVVVATPPEGVTDAGAKVQVAPEGKPEQANVVAELNPLSGVMEMVVVALWPGVMVSEVGDAVTVIVGGGKSMVYAADATALLE